MVLVGKLQTERAAPPARTQWRRTGFVGSLLIALAALGAGVLPEPDPWQHTPVLSLLQSGAGYVGCIVVAVIGMLTLVAAWLQLGRGLERTDVRELTRTAIWWAVPLALAPPILSRDVYAYAAAGDLVQHGMNPYQHGPADLPSRWLSSTSSSWYHVPFAYGPLFLVLTGFAATLAAGHLIIAIALMRVVAILGVVALAWGLPRLAERCGVDPRRAVWLGLANPLVLAHFVGGAHADALLAGLVVAGLALAVQRHPAWGVVLLTLAVAVKATAGLALPFIVLIWAAQRSGPLVPRIIAAAGRGIAIFAVLFAGLSVASGLGFGWITSVSTVGKTEQWTSVSTGVGQVLGNLLGALGVDGAYDTVLAVTRDLGLLAFAVLALVLWLRARADDPALIVELAGWTLLGFVLLGPVVHPWYLLWGVTVLAASTSGRRRVRSVVVGSALLCFLVLPDGYNLARATVVPGQVLDVLILLGVIGWLVRRRSLAAADRVSV